MIHMLLQTLCVNYFIQDVQNDEEVTDKQSKMVPFILGEQLSSNSELKGLDFSPKKIPFSSPISVSLKVPYHESA